MTRDLLRSAVTRDLLRSQKVSCHSGSPRFKVIRNKATPHIQLQLPHIILFLTVSHARIKHFHVCWSQVRGSRHRIFRSVVRMRLRQRGLHMRTYWTFHLWPLKQDSNFLDICMVAFNTQESFFSSLEMERNLAQVNSAGSIGLCMRIVFWSYSDNNWCNRKCYQDVIFICVFSYHFSSTPSV